MDTRNEIGEFLTFRRAKISPEKAGLTSFGNRRVTGLRREAVAVLAGVRVPYSGTSALRRRRTSRQQVQPSIQHVLDGLTSAAAFVHNARLDNLAANQLGYALYSDMFSRANGP